MKTTLWQMPWTRWIEKVDAGEVTDISHELPGGFLVYGQVMRAKVIIDGKTYYATGWQPPGSIAYVDLKEWEDVEDNQASG